MTLSFVNVILFEEHELQPGRRLQVVGERARHLLQVLQVQPESKVRVGMIGGGLGEGRVLAVGQEVQLEVSECRGVAPQSWVRLAIALPRPQTLKKVLQTSAAMGVREILLFRSARVEKSYFSSPLLRESGLREHLLLGMEQAGVTMMPKVSIVKTFADCLDWNQSQREESPGLLAHPEANQCLAELNPFALAEPGTDLFLAIGPEGGFLPREVTAFANIGFQVFHMGPRILRVETALASLLGQLDLLRTQSEKQTKGNNLST